MKLPKYNGKKLDKETFDRLSDLIFSETPEEKEAIEKAVDKKVRDTYKILVDRGYDPTKLFSRNTPKK